MAILLRIALLLPCFGKDANRGVRKAVGIGVSSHEKFFNLFSFFFFFVSLSPKSYFPHPSFLLSFLVSFLPSFFLSFFFIFFSKTQQDGAWASRCMTCS